MRKGPLSLSEYDFDRHSSESKPWDYGRTRIFTLGDESLVPAPRKWTFTFVPKEHDLAVER